MVLHFQDDVEAEAHKAFLLKLPAGRRVTHLVTPGRSPALGGPAWVIRGEYDSPDPPDKDAVLGAFLGRPGAKRIVVSELWISAPERIPPLAEVFTDVSS